MLRLPEFRYFQPATVKQALALKADAGPEGMYVAGGTDLYPNMKRRHQEPKVVVSLAAIRLLRRKPAETRNGGAADGDFALGAGLTLAELADHRRLGKRYPAVSRAAELISTPPLRNMGTLGGNLCLDTRCNYYDQSYEWRKAIDFCMKKDGAICWVAPSSRRCWAVQSSDLAPVMVALDARFVVIGPSGERVVPAAQFYRNDGIAYLTKAPDEILAEVILPAANGWDATYLKLRRRGSFDFPVLGVAAWVRWDGRAVADARIVLGGIASAPQDVPEAARAIRGSRLEEEAVRAAGDAAFKPAKPMDNTDFGLAWRKEMARTYVRRALEELRDRRR
jgi:4-hydroxybenzoyl-CoA reductase subunit beta